MSERSYSGNLPQDDKEGVGGGEGHQDGEDGGDASGNDRDHQGAAKIQIQTISYPGSIWQIQLAVQRPT